MKKILFFIHLILFLAIVRFEAQAVYDPLSVTNNKIGIHILFPEELNLAAELVNSSGGDWGYVTIPIQAGDKDLQKWQNFMNNAKNLHIIPIVRLATEGDYFDKTTWRKPKPEDVMDFANFLDSLEWPVKNRYIIVFNEVNRADEWNGEANPEEYAQILSYSKDLFNSKNENFFIISSGMDNAASTENGTYSQYDYYESMNEAVPGVFEKIDGFSSHSYPNPAFAQPPSVNSPQSISSFNYELELINQLTKKNLPVFITETGWDQSISSDVIVGEYFKEALNSTWSDEKIVAITPFLLNSGIGPFEKFSMIKADGNKNKIFTSIQSIRKKTGNPHLNNVEDKKQPEISDGNLPIISFSDKQNKEGKELKYFVKWLLFPI